MAIEAACPSAIGGSDQSTVLKLRRCSPSATANSQPIAGFNPWNAPRPARASHGQSSLIRLRSASEPRPPSSSAYPLRADCRPCPFNVLRQQASNRYREKSAPRTFPARSAESLREAKDAALPPNQSDAHKRNFRPAASSPLQRRRSDRMMPALYPACLTDSNSCPKSSRRLQAEPDADGAAPATR
jgi:hypothetical protein